MLHELMAPERALPWFALAFSVGYLAGSIPFGLILARVFRLGDLRNIGSGNIGATNVMRTGNKLAAALTLLFDGLKGALPVLFFLGWGDLAAQFAGLGAFVGHCLPVWLRFRGGKGVQTFFGIALALYWPAGLTLAAVCSACSSSPAPRPLPPWWPPPRGRSRFSPGGGWKPCWPWRYWGSRSG